MPDRTPCVKCKKVGFVRWERVLRGGHGFTDYYCGHCDHGWTVADDERRRATRLTRNAAPDKPERSRH
jgi:hypothetical protein